jgi:hypothetical protein
MPEITREYCLAKIAELIHKIDSYDDPDALVDYFLLLSCWRWLAERVGDRPELDTGHFG